MKIVLCSLFLILFFSAVSYAQINRGSLLIGTNFNLLYQNTDNSDPKAIYSNTKANIVGIDPRAGYFIIKNLAIGVEGRYFNEKRQNSSPRIIQDQEYTGHSFSPFLRYYLKIGSKVNFFAHGRIGGYDKSTSDSRIHQLETGKVSTYRTDRVNQDISLAPGMVFFVTDRMGLEIIFGSVLYRFSRNKILSTDEEGAISEVIENSKGISSFFNPPPMSGATTMSLGLHFYLKR
jgi:hypothetical protein